MKMPGWVVICAAASCVCASQPDAMQQWAARSTQIDALYAEGRIRQYRAAADRDPYDPSNWVERAEVCRTVEFRLWLRRPAFRIELRVTGRIPEHTEFSWLDGKLTSLALGRKPEESGAVISSVSRKGSLSVEPYLTPLEYHFFDVQADDAPGFLATRPYRIEGNAVEIDVGGDPQTPWHGALEIDPELGYCPRRMALTIGRDRQRQVSWELRTLNTTRVENVALIAKALVVLYNPMVNAAERVVYLWELTRVERRPIDRADLEITLAPGVNVMDYTTNKRWIVGKPESVEDVDPEELRRIAREVRAQLDSPEIQARRVRAMRWIVGAAVAVTAIVGVIALRCRTTRRAATR